MWLTCGISFSAFVYFAYQAHWLGLGLDTSKYVGGAIVLGEVSGTTAAIQYLTGYVVEITDLVFAVDSIPAIFAITPDPFVVFTSNIFAILGLRALYFCLAALIKKFRFLKPALILILAFVGVKLLLLAAPPYLDDLGLVAHEVMSIKIDPLVSLIVVVGVLVGASVLSILMPANDKPEGG